MFMAKKSLFYIALHTLGASQLLLSAPTENFRGAVSLSNRVGEAEHSKLVWLRPDEQEGIEHGISEGQASKRVIVSDSERRPQADLVTLEENPDSETRQKQQRELDDSLAAAATKLKEQGGVPSTQDLTQIMKTIRGLPNERESSNIHVSGDALMRLAEDLNQLPVRSPAKDFFKAIMKEHLH